MNKENPFELPLTVRGYEIDAFRHVNNAVYVQYFEHCRWMAMKELGKSWLENGLTFVVRKLSVEYEAPAYVFEELLTRLWVDRIGNTSLTFGQDLYRPSDDQILASAEVIAVCVDAQGRPHQVPQEWKDAVGWSDE